MVIFINFIQNKNYNIYLFNINLLPIYLFINLIIYLFIYLLI